MRSHMGVAVVFGVLGALSVAVAIPLASAVQAQEPAGGKEDGPLAAEAARAATLLEDFKPVADQHMLMEWQERVFSGMNRAILQKKDSEVVAHAWMLAELANVNRFHSKKDDYRRWAKDMLDTAVKLAEAGKAKQFDEAKKLARKMNATCSSCHEVYRDDH